MKITRLALTLGATLLTSVAFAGVFTINPTPAPIAAGPGGATTPTSIAFVYTPAANDATIGFQASIAFNTAQVSATVANGAGANGTGGGCTVFSPGVIRIAAADNANVALQAGTYCNLTFTSLAAFTTGTSALPITIIGGGKGCFDQNTMATTCTKVDGSLAVSAGPLPNTPPTLSPLPAAVTLFGGAGTVAVTVATTGTPVSNVALACTIAPGTVAFAITAGANRTIAAPATVGANAPAIGLSCTSGAAAVNGTLTCAQTATPAGAALPALTSTITCPAGTGVAPTATIAATTTLTAGAGTIAVNVVTAGAAGGSLALACTVPPGANNFAITAGANRTITGPAAVGANAPAIGVSCTPPAGPSTTATVTCTQTAVPAGAALAPLTSVATCPGVPTPITANTPPGPITLPSYLTPGPGTSSTTLGFGITGGPGQLACVATGAGYTAAPNPLNMTVGGPNIVTVTYTGTTAGTFAGNLTCTPVAPASGGPFVYTLSTTVGVPVVAVQVPALGNISLMLLIAGFLGLGAVLVGRRQA